MSKTVVGLFPSLAKAEEVKQSLIADGYDDVKVVANDDEHAEGTGVGIGQKISNFFHSLTGGDEHAHHHYANGLNAGGALVTLSCDDDETADAAADLQGYGATEIEGAGEAFAESRDYDNAAKDQVTIPVVAEELVVGKREVDRGGVRVYSHVVEQPVSADVSLRDEFINVERRAVNRPATAADFQAGQGSVLELNATGEEAVVGKTARVVEEVMVGKNATEHTEVVHDSVRNTEVDVEELAGTTGADRY